MDVKYNIWDTITATSTGQNSNGGVYNATTNTLTVPVGQTGIGTYLKKDLTLTSYPQYKTGHRLTFSVIITESVSGLATPSISFNMNKTTTGGSVNNVGTNISSVRINATKVRYSLDYTVTSIDTVLSPFVQINQEAEQLQAQIGYLHG
ncbi:hypothetical protein ACFFJX_12650 [Pseudarcicella hirudinis]|uniref:hypothetical protein n=1 Tax=Pseudarcicella hirudinis TaxID=1079859 RepID=UPI0035EF6342